MSNVLTELKAEINRLAAKAARAHTTALKRSSAQYRRDIAGLKREVAALRKTVSQLDRQVPKTLPAAPVEGGKLRFVAKGFKTMRAKLGLSAEQLGKLLEVSGLSVYKWESGKARPRKAHLPKIAAVRAMGKRQAMALLEKASPKAKRVAGRKKA